MVLGFIGVILDLGGLMVNMYCLCCKSFKVEVICCCLFCVYFSICVYMDMDYKLIIDLYCCVCELFGIKKILIVLGVCYDLVVEDLEYVKELVFYYVGGYLKIVLEYIEDGFFLKMMKLGMGSYYCFKELFDKYL